MKIMENKSLNQKDGYTLYGKPIIIKTRKRINYSNLLDNFNKNVKKAILELNRKKNINLLIQNIQNNING